MATNLYPGTCTRCNGHVPANAGERAKVDGRWTVSHLDGQCPTAADKAVQEAERIVREAQQITEPGFFAKDGNIYRVVRSGGGNLYVTTLVITTDAQGNKSGDYAYLGGLRNTTLTRDDALTYESATHMGLAHGFCILCCKALSDPISALQGVGPSCVKRVGGKRWTKTQYLAECKSRGVAPDPEIVAPTNSASGLLTA